MLYVEKRVICYFVLNFSGIIQELFTTHRLRIPAECMVFRPNYSPANGMAIRGIRRGEGDGVLEQPPQLRSSLVFHST